MNIEKDAIRNLFPLSVDGFISTLEGCILFRYNRGSTDRCSRVVCLPLNSDAGE